MEMKFNRVVYNAWQVNYQSCWIHLAFTFDNQSNTLSIYFNGVRMQTGYLLAKQLCNNENK